MISSSLVRPASSPSENRAELGHLPRARGRPPRRRARARRCGSPAPSRRRRSASGGAPRRRSPPSPARRRPSGSRAGLAGASLPGAAPRGRASSSRAGRRRAPPPASPPALRARPRPGSPARSRRRRARRSRPRARNVRAAAIPFTPAPTTAAVWASGRPSVSAASTAAAPVRSAVTAPASRTARNVPFDASESSTSPITVGNPCAGLPGKDVTHFSERVAAAERGHGAKVPGGIRRHVDLRRHRPLAARVRDERVAHRLERALRRDRSLDVLRGEDRDPAQTDLTAAISFSIAALASSKSITVFGS